jgi:hypothetical protein
MQQDMSLTEPPTLALAPAGTWLSKRIFAT